MAYMVTQRTHEIGIRMALGASRERVLAMVLGQAGVLLAIGIVAGVAGALVLARLLAAQLFGVSVTDPTVYAAVSALLVTVGLVAVAVPSLRATRIDPNIALR